MPVAARMVLFAMAIGLGVVMLLIGTGVASKAAAELGKAVNDAMSHVNLNPSQAPNASGVTDLTTPVLDKPDNDGYTRLSKITLTGNAPSMAVGKKDYLIRIYAIQADGKRLRYDDVPVGATVEFQVANVALNQGPNTFVATLVAPTGESTESDPVVYTLDTTAPKITITSPASKAQITGATVQVSGKTEAGAAISVQNGQAPSTGDSLAGADGTFKVTVALAAGDNNLTITATDKAGNTGTARLTVHRSLGKLAAFVTANPNKITAHKTTTLVVTVRATASDGSPLANASVVFNIEVHGLGPIQSPQLTTNNVGQASWTTTIQEPTPGPGLVSVVVTAGAGADVTASTPLTVVNK